MKIAFVVHTAYPEFIGGREYHIHSLATIISKTDNVVVLAGGEAKKEQRRFLGGYLLINLPMLSIRVSRNPLQIYRIIPGISSSLKRENPDLIHAFEYGSYTSYITYRFSKKYNVPFVLTVYGYQFRNPALSFLKIFYDRIIGRQIFKKAERIFYPSEEQRKEILKVSGRMDIEGKLVLMENCIETDNYRDIALKEELVKQYNLNGQVRLVTVARILPRKGIKYLIFAMHKVVHQYKLKNLKLMIVGPDCGEAKNIVNLIKRLNLEDNVITVGAVPYHRIKEFLGICDIFVLPSLYEGMPLSLLEAMACGKAVIFSDLLCAKKLITDGKDGLLVSPSDVGSLAGAIAKLSTDKELREYLGFNARQKCLEFDSKIEAKRIREIYGELF
jgi:L-malate glycosyltransferase